MADLAGTALLPVEGKRWLAPCADIVLHSFSDKAVSSSVRLKGKRCPYHCAERGTAPLTRLLGT